MSLKDIHPALFSFLTSDAAIAALIDASGGKFHLYPNVLPQGVRVTSVTYQEISARGDHHNGGPSGLAAPRFQISSWGKTPSDARALALAIRVRLDGYKGVMGSGGGAVTVQGVFFESERDIYDAAIEMHGKQSDYFFWFEEN